MNTIHHRPLGLRVEPVGGSQEGAIPNQVALGMQYRVGGGWQYHANVYLPLELRPALTGEGVRGVRILSLELGGRAQRAIPGRPLHVVVGVEARDGTWTTALPPELRNARVKWLIHGLLACVVGIAAIALGPLWVGVVALVAGTHILRTGSEIPRAPKCARRASEA